uniref:SH2 domain-containing protein n=1 Tax=Timema monikensis TaxID=170555 RepID=A0A7R9EC11_9NEOP|nr:unnamed protein product [Timema monikensis]
MASLVLTDSSQLTSDSQSTFSLIRASNPVSSSKKNDLLSEPKQVLRVIFSREKRRPKTKKGVGGLDDTKEEEEEGCLYTPRRVAQKLNLKRAILPTRFCSSSGQGKGFSLLGWLYTRGTKKRGAPSVEGLGDLAGCPCSRHGYRHPVLPNSSRDLDVSCFPPTQHRHNSHGQQPPSVEGDMLIVRWFHSGAAARNEHLPTVDRVSAITSSSFCTIICGEGEWQTIEEKLRRLELTRDRMHCRGFHPPSRGDAFLEPYMQGLGPDFTSPHHHHHHLSSKTPEGGSVTSSPAGDGPNNHNTKTTLADLSAPFRLLELDGSADSLDQEQDSSLSSGSGSSGGDSRDAPCDIGLVERLIRSHPVWFLPGIQRAGAFHLLQSKEEGNFVVRQSSQPDTMAISVRLPAGKGPYIEHYLIQAVDGQLSLESSDNRFDNIPQLIAHYSQCCDELPVQLSLPRAMREAKNRQQLSSLALLGQEFWRYPMANPRPPERSQVGVEMTTLQQSPPSSGSSLSSLGSGNNNNHLNSSSTNTGAQTPTSELGGDAIVLNLTPLYSVEPLQTPSLLTTFKGSDITANNTSPTVMSSATIVVTSSSTATNVCTASVSRGPRPTPPNTLNLVCSASSQTATLSAGVRSSNSSPAQQVTSPPSCNGDGGSSSRSGPLVVSGGGKTPPPPPPRWAKPTALSSGGQNFTVTTTVTFSVNNTTPPPHVEVSCVQRSCIDTRAKFSFQVAPKQSQIEDGHLTTSSHGSTLDQRSMRLHQVVSPSTPTETTKLPANNRVKKHRPNHLRQSSVKESHHYQESDILDSPTVYYRSSVADKFSDYEDIWGPEMLSTFKPTNQIPRSSPFSSPEDISSSSGGISKRTPDLLERIGTPVSGSCISLNSGSNNLKEQKNRLGLVINTNTCNSNSHSPLSPPSDGKSDGPAASNYTKQGSPFYAEPADALKQSSVIARRRPRVVQSAFPHHQPRNHRHSDPTFFQQWPASTSYHAGGLERIDSTEELPLSSSVDNLALLKNSRNILATQTSGGNRPKGKPVQPPRVRPSHGAGKSFNDTSWAVDSSWEFIGNEDEGVDGEGGEERERRFPSLEQQETSLEEGEGYTVSTVISPNRGPSDIDSSGFSSRMSSYDNVEGRNLHHDSNHHHLNIHNAHPCGSHISDDDTQTIFSEPWDSSRWENLLHMESSESVSNSAVQESSAERLLVPEGNALCDAPSNQSIVSQVKRSKSFKERLDPLLFLYSSPREADFDLIPEPLSHRKVLETSGTELETSGSVARNSGH